MERVDSGHGAIVIAAEEHRGSIASVSDDTLDILYAPIDGEATLKLGSDKIAIPANDMMFVAAGTPHEVIAGNGLARVAFDAAALGLHIFELAKDSPVLLRFLRAHEAQGGFTPIVHARYSGDLMAFNNVVRLMKENRRGGAGAQEAMDCLFEYTLISLMRSYSFEVELSKDMRDHPETACLGCACGETLPAVIGYIRDHCADVTLKETAERFGYHPNSISLMLKRSTGRSFSEITHSCRMELASSLLMRTDMTVEAVARECGYQHMGSFYKAFHDWFGTSPRCMREAS